MDARAQKWWEDNDDGWFEEGLREAGRIMQQYDALMHEFPERFTHYHLKVRIPMEAITRELLEDDQCWEWERKTNERTDPIR